MKDEENRSADEFFDEAEDAPSSIILLTDEDGNDAPFEFLDLIPYEDGEYVVLLPAYETDDEDEDTDMVVILKVEEDGEGNESYVSVEDEGVLQAVFELFKERFADEFHFED